MKNDRDIYRRHPTHCRQLYRRRHARSSDHDRAFWILSIAYHVFSCLGIYDRHGSSHGRSQQLVCRKSQYRFDGRESVWENRPLSQLDPLSFSLLFTSCRLYFRQRLTQFHVFSNHFLLACPQMGRSIFFHSGLWLFGLPRNTHGGSLEPSFHVRKNLYLSRHDCLRI